MLQSECRCLRPADALALQPCCLVSKSGRRHMLWLCTTITSNISPHPSRVEETTRKSGASRCRSRLMQDRARHGASAWGAIPRNLRHLFVMYIVLKPRRAINLQTVDLRILTAAAGSSRFNISYSLRHCLILEYQFGEARMVALPHVCTRL